MSNFQQRFKGKTSLMTKEGVDGVIKDSDNPIRKQNERNPIPMEDFTGAYRYSSQKKEAQTFDINRPFFSPDRLQNANIYSVTYSKPNKSVDQHLLVHNQNLPAIQGSQPSSLPPRYPQSNNPIQNQRMQNGMNEKDSIDQQIEQLKYQQQIQSQLQQQQYSMMQGSRQGGMNSNLLTPNNKIPIMKQTFQTDNGVVSYSSNINGNSQQASSLNSIKSNGNPSTKKPHAPISANLNNRPSQPQSGIQAIPFKGLNQVQSSTSSSLQQKSFNYQKDIIDSAKYQNGNQFSNMQAQNGYNMLYNNMNNSYQQNSREMLHPISSNFATPSMNTQQSQQGYYQMSNNGFANNPLPSLQNHKPQSLQPHQINYDSNDYNNSRAYSAKFQIQSMENRGNGGSYQNGMEQDNQYEEAPFLKGERQTEVKRVRNQSRETTNKSFNEMPSSSNSLSNYKPYTLNEYKSIQKNTNYKMGGLGPNIGNDDWQIKREQLEKRQEFAKQIQQINTSILKSQQDQGKIATVKFNKEVSTREKALEFAKNIPKPPPNANKGTQSTNTLGANNTLTSVSNQPSGVKEKVNSSVMKSQQDNTSRNAYSSINNYQSQDPFTEEQENQPSLNIGQNQDIDFHEQQHLEFLNQIEKLTK